MSNQELNFIRVMLERSNTGLYIATSPDLAGVCVTHRDIRAIHDDFPNVVKLWFKSTHDIDVEVYNKSLPQDEDQMSWQSIVLPAEVAAAHLNR